jgi:DNA replication factor GINS
MLGTLKYSQPDLFMMPPLLEPLTYEEVTEIYRKEQKTKNVTEIRKDFYPALRDMLIRLWKESEKVMVATKFSTKAGLLDNQMKKISEKALQIFDFRAEKIMLTALRAAGGTKVEIDRLTEEEKVLFEKVFASVKEQRGSVLEMERMTVGKAVLPSEPEPVRSIESPLKDTTISMIRRPEVKSEPSGDMIKSPKDAGFPEEIEEIEETVKGTAKPQEVGKQVPKSAEEYLMLRILEDIPSFAGPDKNYKLSREDIVTLPMSIAATLINKGKAVQLIPSRPF